MGEEKEDEKEGGEVRRGRAETAGETFQRERASLGTAGNSLLLLPAAAAEHQMAAAMEDTPQNGSREEPALVATVEPSSSGAQQASKGTSNGHQAPSPHPQPGGTPRKNL